LMGHDTRPSHLFGTALV